MIRLKQLNEVDKAQPNSGNVERKLLKLKLIEVEY